MKILKADYEVIKRYYDTLEKWSRGYSTTVTRAMYQDIAPILRKYNYSVGPLTCSYCCLQLCQHAWATYNAYLDQKKEDNNQGKKNGK